MSQKLKTVFNFWIYDYGFNPTNFYLGLQQGRHGKFLPGKTIRVVDTSPARRHYSHKTSVLPAIAALL